MSEALATYRTASETGDIDAVMSTLAPGAELISPVSGRFVFRGEHDLRILLSAVYAGLRGLRWDEPIGDGDVRVLVGTAKIGPVHLGDAMVFELAPDGPDPAHPAAPPALACGHRDRRDAAAEARAPSRGRGPGDARLNRLR